MAVPSQRRIAKQVAQGPAPGQQGQSDKRRGQCSQVGDQRKDADNLGEEGEGKREVTRDGGINKDELGIALSNASLFSPQAPRSRACRSK